MDDVTAFLDVLVTEFETTKKKFLISKQVRKVPSIMVPSIMVPHFHLARLTLQ